MGTQRPTPKGAELHPIFSPRLCGHTAVWIKMPLGTEVGLGLRDTEVDLAPGHIVLDGIPAQQPPPLFGPCLLWPRSPISATAELLL